MAGGNRADGKHHPAAAGMQLAAGSRRTVFSTGLWNANGLIALSGACATIASDALMNPFDGVIKFLLASTES